MGPPRADGRSARHRNTCLSTQCHCCALGFDSLEHAFLQCPAHTRKRSNGHQRSRYGRCLSPHIFIQHKVPRTQRKISQIISLLSAMWPCTNQALFTVSRNRPQSRNRSTPNGVVMCCDAAPCTPTSYWFSREFFFCQISGLILRLAPSAASTQEKKLFGAIAAASGAAAPRGGAGGQLRAYLVCAAVVPRSNAPPPSENSTQKRAPTSIGFLVTLCFCEAPNSALESFFPFLLSWALRGPSGPPAFRNLLHANICFHVISALVCMLQFCMRRWRFHVFFCYMLTAWDGDDHVELVSDILDLLLTHSHETQQFAS